MRIVDLFTRDGVFGESAGRDALVKAYQATFERAATVLGPLPFIHNHVIEFDGPDRATGRCYLDLRWTTNDAAARSVRVTTTTSTCGPKKAGDSVADV